ncbi:FecR family protein [Maribacter litopenaei]|uniref:FecR family protein n=1 Tax=Maribacter litopenaei TaxID=2976127 RepID=A0ABY5YDM3_9FLAO|nr:FecR family protein [Maribacter litopenaei]UWX56505.1 FecR family protein [Maribacter litopenaei]
MKIASFLYLLLFAFAASCGTNIKIKTEENYETTVLPDGSQVYLNQHSSISFQESFQPGTIKLKGEAFFEVEHGDLPFTVLTDHGEVVVLGTEFNVKTTAQQVEVDVKKGLVELRIDFNSSKIKRDSKAIYSEGEKVIKELTSDKEYRKWIRSLEKEFKKLGREVKPALKKVSKEFKKAGKTLK